MVNQVANDRFDKGRGRSIIRRIYYCKVSYNEKISIILILVLVVIAQDSTKLYYLMYLFHN